MPTKPFKAASSPDKGYIYALVTEGHSQASYRLTGALWLNGRVAFEPADPDIRKGSASYSWSRRIGAFKAKGWDDKTIFYYLTKQGAKLGIHCSEPADAMDLNEIRQQIRRAIGLNT